MEETMTRYLTPDELQFEVELEPNDWIELPDGTRLAVRLWRPRSDEPVPVAFSYLPYRKSDQFAIPDHVHGSWFAGHGIAFARVDVRGSGDSDGIITDEYSPDELADAPHVIQWLATRPWCNGAVGMIGSSWGGFNALQVAAMRPPALRAIVSMCASDDGYADDVHYYGGCLLASEQLPWGTFMLPMNALPPNPAAVGERWRDMWLARLAAVEPWATTWTEHQRRDEYWRGLSPAEDRAAITCPTLMVGGWADGYVNAVMRFLEHAEGPRWGLIGPWGHGVPHETGPGPRIGFLQECLRWWNRWLRDEPNGVDDEPMLRAYVQETVRPERQHEDRPGRWVADESWPSPRVAGQRLALGDGVLGEAPAEEVELAHRGAQQHGELAGTWCPHGAEADFPPDQRPEDALCLTFDGAPLTEPLDVLGRPLVRLALRADQPTALVVARLCAVAPDGTSVLVTRGALNLTHRDGHDRVDPLEPGARYEVDVVLDAIGQTIAPGWRLRLALSTTYWPWLWPSPTPVELTVIAGPDSWLELPLRTGDDGPAVAFEEPQLGEPPPFEPIPGELPYRRISYDPTTGEHVQESNQNGNEGAVLGEHGPGFQSWFHDRSSIHEGDPLSAQVRCRRRMWVNYLGTELRVETTSSMSADADAFHLLDTLEAFEGPRRIFVRSWSRAVARDGV